MKFLFTVAVCLWLSPYVLGKAIDVGANDVTSTQATKTKVIKREVIDFSPRQVDIGEGDRVKFTVSISYPPKSPFVLNLTIENPNVVAINLHSVRFDDKALSNEVTLEGLSPGHSAIFVSDNIDYDTEESWIYVSIYRSQIITTVGDVVGWIYFATWSLSFWPQIIYVFRRKSVIGLSFDYVAMNLTGHLCYCFFNACLYWSAVVQKEYDDLHPRGLIQVQINDVAYSIHASAVGLLLAFECCIYERGGQRMSKICMGLLGLIIVSATILLILSSIGVTTFLTYLYYFSYVKLALTIVKYSPQVYFNYRRKSTEGWSIYNVLLDFVGGLMSIFQMFLLAYNYDDWGSIFGDPSKFGLGAFSAMFDVIFMVQHFCIYRRHDDQTTELVLTKDPSKQPHHGSIKSVKQLPHNKGEKDQKARVSIVSFPEGFLGPVRRRSIASTEQGGANVLTKAEKSHTFSE